MSAVQTTAKYKVYRCLESNGAETFEVRDCTRYGLPADYFRSYSAAEYAARLLNDGLASVDQHATVGCKVVAR